MKRVRQRGEQVRRFILEQLEAHPRDIVRTTADRFAISRQAVNRHLMNLVAEKAIVATGATRAKEYRLAPLEKWTKSYPIERSMSEDALWREVAPSLAHLPRNVVDIWHYGFTEMLNNVIDHSAGTTATVTLEKTAARTEMSIADDGVGIFRKIQAALGLVDERHAVLELAKGKFTTDPAHHSGEGIFFTSRSFDDFAILSGNVYFSHDFGDTEDWILERHAPHKGTAVWMVLHNHTARTMKSVFDQFTSGDDLRFTKTVVPVKLAQYGDDNLISRSQAKRLLARIDRFRTVVLDFNGVASIGHSFADEIFRVFQQHHADVEVIAVGANDEVAAMIARAKSNLSM